MKRSSSPPKAHSEIEIVRLVWLVAMIPLPFIPLVYFICALVIPREPEITLL